MITKFKESYDAAHVGGEVPDKGELTDFGSSSITNNTIQDSSLINGNNITELATDVGNDGFNG